MITLRDYIRALEEDAKALGKKPESITLDEELPFIDERTRPFFQIGRGRRVWQGRR